MGIVRLTDQLKIEWRYKMNDFQKNKFANISQSNVNHFKKNKDGGIRPLEDIKKDMLNLHYPHAQKENEETNNKTIDQRNAFEAYRRINKE